LGRIHLELGQLEKAAEEFSLAVQYAPNRADFKTNLEAARKRVKP
jgi:hypothetical protein